MVTQAAPVHQDTYFLRDMAPRGVPQDDTRELVKVLADAISANRLPNREPAVFSGDPLKFNHWKSYFQTLIEKKNIPTAEKIFFLQIYVGGAAKESLEGYFLMNTEDAYNAAWDLLNKQYGVPFVVAKAFRDRIHAWPIKDLDHEQLKEYGCQFIMNAPSSNHMGGVWERQIKTIRSVLTAILDQFAKRFDRASLRTFLYEVMAIINSRLLTTEHLTDPTSLESLTPNHIHLMKSETLSPPPGQFVSQDFYLCKRWRQVQFW